MGRFSAALERAPREPGASSDRRNNQKEVSKHSVENSSPPLPWPEGIEVWHDCDDATLDICFVHGLAGDRDSTWTADGQSTPWPKMLLPPELSGARILAFGYNPVRNSLTGPNRLIDQATNLLGDLATYRDCHRAPSRSLIFIAHSSGGLVCKKAILLSQVNPKRKLRAIFHCTDGIIFMGTPHEGAWMTDWAKIPAQVLSPMKSIDTSLLKILDVDNPRLETIHADFQSMLHKLEKSGRELLIACFYEELPLPIAGTIVSSASAILRGYPKYSTRADHINMVKFSSPHDQEFNSLLGELRRMKDRTSTSTLDDHDYQYLKSLWGTHLEDEKLQIEESKGGLLEDVYHWILENHEFQQWLDDPQSQLLWIRGDYGTGKTMLLCGIIDELKDLNMKSGCLAFFFCGSADLRTNHATAILRGLIYELVNQQPALISHVREKFDYLDEDIFKDANCWITLSQIFTNILEGLAPRKTFLIVDAINECRIGRRELLYMIVRKWSSYPHVKWLISSRSLPSIQEHLNSARQISLEFNVEPVSTAVELYIDHKVRQLAELKSYDTATQYIIHEHLSQNANGTFLWIVHACRYLTKETSLSIFHALEKLSARLLTFEYLHKQTVKRNYDPGDISLWPGVSEECIAEAVMGGPVPLSSATLKESALRDGAHDPQSVRGLNAMDVPLDESDHNVILSEVTHKVNDPAMVGIPAAFELKDVEGNSASASISRLAKLYASSGEKIRKDRGPLATDESHDTQRSYEGEIQSLVTDNDDIGFQASAETTSGEMAGKAPTRLSLAEKPNSRALCKELMARMGRQRFVVHLRRLLKLHYKNLSREAQNEREKQVANLLKSRRGRWWISEQLALRIQTEQEEDLGMDRADLEVGPGERQDVETWLGRIPEGTALESTVERPPVPRESENEDIVNQSSESDSDDHWDGDEYPHISELTLFLQKSRSFDILLRDFMLMLLPPDLKHVLLAIPKKHIWVSQEQDVSLSNRMKSWVEDNTLVRWNWWPLEPRKRLLQVGESRLFWQCTCGAQQWEEITAEQRPISEKDTQTVGG